MDAVELMIRHTVVGLIQANCYIVGSKRTGKAICIDPGDEVDEIMALAREMKVTISSIVSTHGHLDHLMAVRALKEETGAPFLLHEADLEIARGCRPRRCGCSGGTSSPRRSRTSSWRTTIRSTSRAPA